MRVGIIGCGSLGTAILKSYLSKYSERSEIMVSVRSEERKKLLQGLKCKITDNKNIASFCDEIYICVKPGQAQDICRDISENLDSHTVIISVMAGVPQSKIQSWLNHDRVVKIMPTLNIEKGPITIYNPNKIDISLPGSCFVPLSEDQVDKSTSVSGCMPGFLAYILEQWIDAGVKNGMDRKNVETLVLQNVRAFTLSSYIDLQEHRQKVASKGGATEQGLSALQKVHATLENMIKKADTRVQELVKSFQ